MDQEVATMHFKMQNRNRTMIHRSLSGVLVFLGLLTFTHPVFAEDEVYTPPGYESGYNIEGSRWGLVMGFKQVEEDYYWTVVPRFSFSFWDVGIGLQFPVDFLLYDRDPKSGDPAGTVRHATYDTQEDFAKIVRYIRYGQHLYYDPEDLFNFSFYIGAMGNGYIGHKTIIHRYVSSYDPTTFKASFMADINNNWGGVELFANDLLNREVRAYRVFIRPVHFVQEAHNLFVGGFHTPYGIDRQLAMSREEFRDPERNGGVFFQERLPRQGKGGRLGQYRFRTLKQDVDEQKALEQENGGEVRFEERYDPNTGRTQVRAVRARGNRGDQQDESAMTPEQRKAMEEKRKERAAGTEEEQEEEESKGTKWNLSWLNRLAIGYTMASDYDAPLELEKDGAGNLIIDPDTTQPRTSKVDNLHIQGWDVEFRLSPVDWLDFTPYVDQNRFVNLDDAVGLHYGVNFEFKFGTWLKLGVRPELREMSSNYIPTYFDSYYSVERLFYNPGGTGNDAASTTSQHLTKYQYVSGLSAGGEKVQGQYVEVIADFVERLVVELQYEDMDGPGNSAVFLGIYVPPFSGIFFNGYYMKKHFDNYKNAFDYDENSLAAGQVGFDIFAGFYVSVTMYRTWKLNSESQTFTPTDEYVYGFGYSAAF